MSKSSSNIVKFNLKNKTKDIQGGEKKVMKKSLKVIATATMAFSMFASVAMAAETTGTTTTPTATTTATTVKTSKDFKDLAGLDATVTAKIDAMLAKKYFEGTADDSFGIKENMTRAQFAKVLVLVAGIKVDDTVKTSSFDDVKADDKANGWAIPFIEAAKTAGLVDGKTDKTFDPGANVTLGEFATALVKGLGIKPDTTGTPWYADAVKQAVEKKLLPEGTDGSKFATRADLVVGAFQADAAIQSVGKVSLSEAKATGVQTVTVSFNKVVDTTKATVSLKKGTVDVATTAKWSDDKKTATLTLTSVKISEGTYTATLGGVDAATVAKASAEFTAQDEAVSKIEFLNAGDTIAKTVTAKIKLKATNQYGENASFSAGSYTVYAGNNNDVSPVLSKNSNGELILTLNTAVTNGATTPVDLYQSGISILPVNIFQNDNHVTVSKNFKVGTVPFISKMELGAVKYSNGSDALTGTGETATFDVVNYDQYGNVLAFDSNVTTGDVANTRVIFNAYEPNLTFVVGDSDNDGVTDVKISLLNNVDKAADYSFTVYNQAGTATSKVAIKSGKVATKVEIGELTSVIAAGDADAYVPLVAYDATGNKLSVDDLVNDQNFARINISSSTGTGNATLQRSGENKGKIKIVNIPGTPRSVVSLNVFITSINAVSTANKTYTVASAPIPDRITVATEPAKKIVAGLNAESKFKFVVYDQHGREYKVAKNIDAAGNITGLTGAGIAEYRVSVTGSTYGTGITSTLAAGTFDANIGSAFNQEYKFTAPTTTSVGASATINAVIEKRVGGSGAFTAINSPITRTIEAISSTADLTYSVNAVSDLFNAIDSASVATATYDNGPLQISDTAVQEVASLSKFAREVSLSATDAAGNKVALPSTIQSITTSDPTVAKVEVTGGKAYVIGNKVGTASLNVAYLTSKGAQAIKTISVKTKNDLLQSTKVAVGNTTATITAAKAAGSNGFILSNVKVTDNYGITFEGLDAQKYNYVFGVTFSVANVLSTSGTGKVTVDRYGNLAVDSDVTSFELTATSANGFSASTFIN
ncbi:hypothetical protein QFZ77_000824 [Paenibacillus sp. V4I3]|uniref:S-layer homology domain-containing protein n=1 Tax=Paenibacillus sp. V4I3 TaxID=3042305 RepID=UPI002784243F|nr:S-layer homology domain-containing protein [Paenibacillus sp. V4I3]MDQ0872165.1 hypothetical protein [Paenibacillus sp. V4I3]